MTDTNANYGILQPITQTNPIKTSGGSSAPQAGPIAQQQSIQGNPFAQIKQMFGTNPVSTASNAINDQMQTLSPQALAAGLLGGKTASPQPTQAPQASDPMQSPVNSLNAPTAPVMGSQGIPSPQVGMLAPPPKSNQGFDTKNHVLNDISDPQVQNTAIHSAVTAAAKPDATPMEVAQSYVGTGRQAHADVMEGFIKKSTGGNVNIQNTPWCAAFANSVLASTGHGQTGSLAAQSFLKYGQSTKTPSTGDVVVMQRGGADSGLGHVGFFAGYSDDHQRVKVLAGNTNGQVMTKEYALNTVMDFRVPPSAKELMAKANGEDVNMAEPKTMQEGEHYDIKRKGINLNSETMPSIEGTQDPRTSGAGQSYASARGIAGSASYNPSTGRYA